MSESSTSLSTDPPPESDAQLAARVQAGDAAAFDEVMRRYKRPLVSFAFRMLGTAHEAEDIAQGVFVRAYFAVRERRFRIGPAKFSTWLFTLTRNACVDALRRRGRRAEQSLDHPGPLATDPAVTRATPATDASSRELGAAIAAAVAELPEDQKTALILSAYEDLSYAEIAAIMKCSGKSVEARLYRARQFLRQRLAHLLRQ